MFKKTSLESISIPGSVETVRGGTFEDCKELTKVVYGEGVERIDVSAFIGADNYNDYVFPASLEFFIEPKRFKDLKIENMTFNGGKLFYKDNCIYDENGSLLYYTGDSENNKSTTFAKEVKSCKDLRYFPSLGGNAEVIVPGFNGEEWHASNLKRANRLVIENANKVKEISIYEGNSGSTEVVVGEVTALPKFNKGASLESLEVKDPAKVVKIPDEAFVSCKNFDIDLSQFTNLQTIGNSAFNDDTSLKNIYIGNSITSIGNNAFSGCTGVNNLYYHAVNEPAIGKDAFKDVVIKKVELGKEIKKVSEDKISEMVQNSKAVLFEGENTFEVTPSSTGKSSEFLVTAGKYYVDNQGVVYRYSDDGKSATVMFVSEQRDGKVTIPWKIKGLDKAEKDVVVNKVADKAFFYKSGRLTEIDFERPEKIKEISPSLWEDRDKATKINGETDAQKIANSFTDIKVDLLEDIDPSNDKDALKKKKIVDEKNKSRVEVSIKSKPSAGEDNSFLTGENVSFTFKQDGDRLTASGAKIYLQFSSEDGSVELSKELKDIARIEDGDIPNSKVIVIDKLDVGTTGGHDFSCKYSSGSKGGNLRLWIELVENPKGSSQEGTVKVPPYKDKDYVKVDWNTDKAKYRYNINFIEKDRNYFRGDGKGHIFFTKCHLKNNVKIIKK